MDIIDKICDENEFAESIYEYSAEKLKTSQIRNFFVGKVVFLTGATGFLGQLYLEKLLRCDAERVFILARSKKDKPAIDRLKEIFNGPHFGWLRKQDPNFIERVTIINGNLDKLHLNISEKDMQMLQETVNIVIHAAADVRFNKRLFDLVLANLRGTREMLRVAEKFKKLQVFAYISTAYSNCVYGSNVYEKFYQPPIDPDLIINYAELIETCPEQMDCFEVITDAFIKPWPNTYTYSKSLSEEVVRRFGEKFPICILRPSVVISTYKEPAPAWTNSVFGINGFIVASGVGIMRLSMCDKNSIFDVMCADFVINGTLAAIWATNEDNKNRLLKQAQTGIDNVDSHDVNPQIYCLGTSGDGPLTHKELTSTLHGQLPDTVCNKFVWIPCVNSTTVVLVFRYLTLFYHVIPSLFFDAVLILTRQKDRLMPIARKLAYYSVAVGHFAVQEWILDNSKMRNLINRLTPLDRELFFFDGRILSETFDDWSFVYLKGLRKYIVGEFSLEMAQSAQTKLKILRFVHIFVLAGFYAIQVLILLGIYKIIF